MSFRRFIYYCAVYAGCAAFLGWAMGTWLGGRTTDAQAGAQGMFLGLWVILVLLLVEAMVALIEAVRNVAFGQVSKIAWKIMICAVLGAFSGWIGGLVGNWLFEKLDNAVFRVVGWTLTGGLIGVSLGVPDLIACALKKQKIGIPLRRLIKGGVGGTVGGIIGSVLFLILKAKWESGYRDANINITELTSPTAVGFIILGMCIGLAIAMAQVLLREAWIKVEQGFRSGREVILSKPEISIGRAEACDIGLFGDNQIEKQHALIRLRDDLRYELVDQKTPSGTFLNDKKIAQPALLTSGDMIRLGRAVLCFREKAKGNAAE
jgi:hypothetical protein